MKSIFKIAVLATMAILMYFTDISIQPTKMTMGVEFVSEAQAVLGVRRRAHRRGAAVGYAAGAEAANEANAAAAQQAQAAPATAAPPPPPVYGPLPQGTTITVLPAGCQAMTAGGVEYQHCGENYFRSAFQGNNLVYVVSTPAEK